jgi:hypothetical protein
MSLHDLICVFYSKIGPFALHNLCTLDEISRWGGFRQGLLPISGQLAALCRHCERKRGNPYLSING